MGFFTLLRHEKNNSEKTMAPVNLNLVKEQEKHFQIKCYLPQNHRADTVTCTGIIGINLVWSA